MAGDRNPPPGHIHPNRLGTYVRAARHRCGHGVQAPGGGRPLARRRGHHEGHRVSGARGRRHQGAHGELRRRPGRSRRAGSGLLPGRVGRAHRTRGRHLVGAGATSSTRTDSPSWRSIRERTRAAPPSCASPTSAWPRPRPPARPRVPCPSTASSCAGPAATPRPRPTRRSPARSGAAAGATTAATRGTAFAPASPDNVRARQPPPQARLKGRPG